MGGFDDHVAIMGDWMPPSPSPRSFFSSMTSDDPFVRSFADPDNENKSASAGFYKGSNSNGPTEPKMSSRGGLMERRAARAGFNAPRLNTQGIRHGDLSKEQEVRSPYLTIPPGLSPTTLLDSPVFLTNSLVQPSPTTGKFAFAPSGNNRNLTLMTDDLDKFKENNNFEDTTSFAFKPIAESRSVPNFNAENKVHASSSFPSFGVSIYSNTSFPHQSIEHPKSQTSNSRAEKNGHSGNLSPDQSYQSASLVDEPNEDDGDEDPNAGSGQTEDGYNWRKYGQKHVKGSEFPRSYYKCTYPNCPVKKKVERSHEGHVTEIIYKGAHTHPKPPPSRRSSSNALESEQTVWSAVHNNLEATSSARSLVEYGNGASLRAHNGPSQYESGDGVNGSCTFSNDDEEEDDDRTTHGSVSLGYDGEGDESELKRRRIEAYASEMSGAMRAIREPRVVVQTTSDVDILDDGYRWRKYGQKVVKGNPNPRSYYKCTSAGCNVRKHVERASNDLKSVITTYEGKHNHDVPAARNSSHHVNSGSLNQQAPSAAVVSSHMQRAGPSQIHTSMGRFERPSSFGSFGLPGRPQQLGPGFGFGLNQQALADLGLADLGHNQGKLPVMPVHTYLGHRPRPMNDMGFVLPKAEPKMEPATDSGYNSSDGSSVYQQLMKRLPLGPQM